MSFEWDKVKKVEMYDPGTRRQSVEAVTPKYVVQNPYGFRTDDIIHSLSIVTGELVAIAEAQAKSLEIRSHLMKESPSVEVKEETQVKEIEVEGGDNGSHDIKRPSKVKAVRKKKPRVSKSSSIKHSCL